MAKRIATIVIEHKPEHRLLEVWSDLSAAQIKSIAGVSMVFENEDESTNAYYDPRYDVESVKADIRALAEPEPEVPAILGLFGAWTAVEDGVPKFFIDVVVKGDFSEACPHLRIAHRHANGAWHTNTRGTMSGITHWTPIPS